MGRERKGYVDSETVSADWYMDKCILSGTRMFSVQVHINNTNLVGDLYVQLSNDGTNWISAPWIKQDPSDSTTTTMVSSESVTTGTDVDLFIQADSVSSGYYRLFFDWTSGSGVIDVTTKLMTGV